MKKNIGTADRSVRIILGALLFPSAVLGTAVPLVGVVLEGVGKSIALVAGVVFLVTGGLGYSPIYGLLGVNTLEKKRALRKKKAGNK